MFGKWPSQFIMKTNDHLYDFFIKKLKQIFLIHFCLINESNKISDRLITIDYLKRLNLKVIYYKGHLV